MENSHIFEDPSKLSVSQKVLSAVKPKYFCEKKSDELHSKCASTVHRLASKRTVNHVHTTLEKNFIALFVQGVPLIFPHHDTLPVSGVLDSTSPPLRARFPKKQGGGEVESVFSKKFLGEDLVFKIRVF